MTEASVRGAGRARRGATDTTMLIWKVIAANPGITRAEIWKHVEHGIPDGYAIRRYVRARSVGARPPAPTKARSYILTDTLNSMRRSGIISGEGDGKDRRYTVAREMNYRGNADAIDETGSKAAEHMAVADALRIAEKWLARAKPDRVDSLGRRSVPVLGPPSRKEYEALVILVKAVRARGSSET